MAGTESEDFSYAEDQELVDQFVAWTTEAVAELKELLAGLTGGESKTHETASRIYDLSHNIKGMGSSFNFPLMTETGTSLCGYIKNLTEDKTVSTRVIEAHVRIFDVVLTHRIHGDGGEKGKALQDRLAVIVSEES